MGPASQAPGDGPKIPSTGRPAATCLGGAGDHQGWARHRRRSRRAPTERWPTATIERTTAPAKAACVQSIPTPRISSVPRSRRITRAGAESRDSSPRGYFLGTPSFNGAYHQASKSFARYVIDFDIMLDGFRKPWNCQLGEKRITHRGRMWRKIGNEWRTPNRSENRGAATANRGFLCQFSVIIPAAKNGAANTARGLSARSVCSIRSIAYG
jgi:hypothetical protein